MAVDVACRKQSSLHNGGNAVSYERSCCPSIPSSCFVIRYRRILRCVVVVININFNDEMMTAEDVWRNVYVFLGIRLFNGWSVIDGYVGRVFDYTYHKSNQPYNNERWIVLSLSCLYIMFINGSTVCFEKKGEWREMHWGSCVSDCSIKREQKSLSLYTGKGE